MFTFLFQVERVYKNNEHFLCFFLRLLLKEDDVNRILVGVIRTSFGEKMGGLRRWACVLMTLDWWVMTGIWTCLVLKLGRTEKWNCKKVNFDWESNLSLLLLKPNKVRTQITQSIEIIHHLLSNKDSKWYISQPLFPQPGSLTQKMKKKFSVSTVMHFCCINCVYPLVSVCLSYSSWSQRSWLQIYNNKEREKEKIKKCSTENFMKFRHSQIALNLEAE